MGTRATKRAPARKSSTRPQSRHFPDWQTNVSGSGATAGLDVRYLSSDHRYSVERIGTSDSWKLLRDGKLLGGFTGAAAAVRAAKADRRAGTVPRCHCGELAITWRWRAAPRGGERFPVCAVHRDELDARGPQRASAEARRCGSSEHRAAAPSGRPSSLAARPAAAVYLRVSTDEQTVDNQRPDVDRLLAVRELELVELYAENVSAAKVRPAFDRMMADAARGRFKVLAIWSLDRFGRSMVGNMNAVRELDRVGVRVVSVREPWLDTTGPVRELLIAIFSWVAEQERVRLGERTRAGMDRARRTGKAIGRPRARIDANELELLLARVSTRGRGVHRGKHGELTLAAIARKLKVSEATLRRELARRAAVERSNGAGPN